MAAAATVVLATYTVDGVLIITQHKHRPKLNTDGVSHLANQLAIECGTK